MSSQTTNNTEAAPTKLQTLNYVNVLAYLSNFLTVFGSTTAGLPSNAVMSDRYQTLVTPAGYAFSIWGIIFTAELVWTIAQVFPSYRSHALVVKGVGYNFALASFAQCLWTVFFGLEKISLSLIAMVCILLPLLSILSKTSSMTTTNTTSDYWLLKFPFQIHASWIMAATLVNVNVLAVAYKASASVQTAIGWASLGVLFCVGIYFAVLQTRNSRSNSSRVWVIPCVLVWASFAISKELASPREQIQSTFSEDVVRRTKIASMVVAHLLVVVMIVELVRSWFFPATDDDDSDSNGQVLDSEVLDSNGEDEGDGRYSSLS